MKKVWRGDFRLENNIRDGKFWTIRSLTVILMTLSAGPRWKLRLTGEFVGQVREACQAALLAIRQHYFWWGWLSLWADDDCGIMQLVYQGSEWKFTFGRSRPERARLKLGFHHQDSKNNFCRYFLTLLDWSKFEGSRATALLSLNNLRITMSPS